MSSRPENRRSSSIQPHVTRSEPTFLVDSDSDDGVDDNGLSKWHNKFYSGGPLVPSHHSRSVTRPRLLVDPDDSDDRGPWHFMDKHGKKYYPGGPSSAVDHYARPVDIDMNEDTRPRHSIITAQAIQEAFHVISTHYPYLHCPIPSWVQHAGPDPRVLNSPTFVRAYQAFRFHYQKMWATLDPSDRVNHVVQVDALNQEIHKLDQAYHRALGH